MIWFFLNLILQYSETEVKSVVRRWTQILLLVKSPKLWNAYFDD